MLKLTLGNRINAVPKYLYIRGGVKLRRDNASKRTFQIKLRFIVFSSLWFSSLSEIFIEKNPLKACYCKFY